MTFLEVLFLCNSLGSIYIAFSECRVKNGNILLLEFIPVRCFMLIINIFEQAVHVAAQYGQTAFLNYIVAKYQADFDAPDSHGRSALHWCVNICQSYIVVTLFVSQNSHFNHFCCLLALLFV